MQIAETGSNERGAAISKAIGGELDAIGLAICGAVKKLSQAEIAALAFGPDADRRVVTAVLNAPALLTGISAEFRRQIEADFISRHTSDGLAKINDSEEALRMIETCVSALKTETADALGLAPHVFDIWFGKEFAPTETELRVEDGDFAMREADAVREAADRLPLSERIKLMDALREQNYADVKRPYDPEVWRSEVASL